MDPLTQKLVETCLFGALLFWHMKYIGQKMDRLTDAVLRSISRRQRKRK